MTLSDHVAVKMKFSTTVQIILTFRQNFTMKTFMHNLQNYIKDTIRVYTEYFSFETIKNVTNNNSIVKINQINDN